MTCKIIMSVILKLLPRIPNPKYRVIPTDYMYLDFIDIEDFSLISLFCVQKHVWVAHQDYESHYRIH